MLCGEDKMLNLIGMGGTFDHLHDGHKYLIGKDEILFVNVPESHVRQLMAKFLNELTSDQKDVLREFIKLMRATQHPWWGM